MIRGGKKRPDTQLCQVVEITLHNTVATGVALIAHDVLPAG
jgi:hypothetical protein